MLHYHCFGASVWPLEWDCFQFNCMCSVLTRHIGLLESSVKDVAKDQKKYYERLVNHSQESLMVSVNERHVITV